jgi:hypothetical protein
MIDKLAAERPSSTEVPAELVFLQWLIDEVGYRYPRPLPGGRYVAVMPLMFTAAIVTGRMGDRIGHDDRWCYHSIVDAKRALDAWDGTGEPAGWHRHPASGRRVSETVNERDHTGEIVPLGTVYYRP